MLCHHKNPDEMVSYHKKAVEEFNSNPPEIIKDLISDIEYERV